MYRLVQRTWRCGAVFLSRPAFPLTATGALWYLISFLLPSATSSLRLAGSHSQLRVREAGNDRKSRRGLLLGPTKAKGFQACGIKKQTKAERNENGADRGNVKVMY